MLENRSEEHRCVDTRPQFAIENEFRRADTLRLLPFGLRDDSFGIPTRRGINVANAVLHQCILERTDLAFHRGRVTLISFE